MILKLAPAALVRSAVRWCPELTGEGEHLPAFVAGGFVRAYYAGEMPTDMDLFCRTSAAADLTENILRVSGWSAVFKTDRATTYQPKEANGIRRTLQVVRYRYGEPSAILEMFDFTVCKAALEMDSGGEGLVRLDDDFFEHLAARILVYAGSPQPLSSLRRVVKYLGRGYHICDENLIALAQDIARLPFGDQEAMAEFIEGMDPDQPDGRRIRAID